MLDTLNDEKILCSINAYKEIKNSTIIGNIFANLISGGVSGRVTNDFKLILTTENIYIEAIGYSTWGGIRETVYKDKIYREDIKSFEVKTEDSKEFIIITKTDEKKMTFIRDNEKENNLASKMAKLILNNQQS